MLNIGPQEILLILIVALVVVGPQRLPEMGRTLGRALKELRKAQDEVKRTVAGVLEEPKPVATKRGSGASAAAGSTTSQAGATDAGDDAAAADAPSTAAQAASVLRPLAETARELRKTREEIQRSFRVDLSGPPSVRPASKPAVTPAAVATDTPNPPDRVEEHDPPASSDAPTEGAAGS